MQVHDIIITALDKFHCIILSTLLHCTVTLYSTRVDPTAVSYARLEKDKGADSEQDITVTFAPEEEKADISAEES